MTQSKGKGARARTGIKEFFRKRVVALKRKPQTIAFLVLLAGFLYFTLNLTVISHTTSIVKNGTGLSAFITILASTLSLVTFLRTYPHRQKVKKVMLILTLVLVCGTVLSDFQYVRLIVGAVTRPNNSYVYDEATADSGAKAMIISQAKKIDEDNAKTVMDQIKGADGKSIVEDKLIELVENGTIDASGLLAEGEENTLENRLKVFYDEDKDGDLVLKSYRGVQMRVQDTFTDMRASLTADGTGNLSAETLDLAKLRTVIDSGALGIRHQIFNEDGSVNLDGYNAAYRDLNGKALFSDMKTHFRRDNYVRVFVRDDDVDHAFADRMFKVTRDSETGALTAELDGEPDGDYVRIVLDAAGKTPVAAELTRKVSENTYRVDKMLDIVLDESDVFLRDVLINGLKAGEGIADAKTGTPILQRADSLYMDLERGADFEGSGALNLTADYKLRYAGDTEMVRVNGDYEDFTRSHHVMIVHMILQLIAVFLILTKPLYGLLIRKINTSVLVEENQNMGAIDISGEE